MKLALEASKDKEKDAVAKVAAAEDRELKWVVMWGEETDKAASLEKEVNSLRTEDPQAHAAERDIRSKLEDGVAALKNTNQRSESKEAALQKLLSDMDAKHKELLDKFNDYKKRMRKMGNEY